MNADLSILVPAAAPPPPGDAPSPDARGATPVMRQFFDAKARQPDALVFFRMGDFYELFFEDARKAADALGITLTYRGKHAGEDIPMAGVPVHAADAYLAKLIRCGFKVAVCEQMEDPAEARRRGSKAIVRRDLVRVVTPGTLTEDSLLDPRGPNRLVAVAVRSGRTAAVSAELSTGEVESLALGASDLAPALAAWRPSEILVADRLLGDPAVRLVLEAAGGALQPLPSALADLKACEDRVRRLYGVATLDGFGPLEPAEIVALGLIAAHLETTQAGRSPNLSPPRRVGASETLSIDAATRTSLEIDRAASGSREGSLLAAVDRTVTGAGARALADRLSRPLVAPGAINDRLDAVAFWVERRGLRQALREALRGGADVMRALSRLALGRGGPRDLAALRDGLACAETIRALLRDAAEPLGSGPGERAETLAALAAFETGAGGDLARDLKVFLVAEPPPSAREGGFIAPGAMAALDAARTLRDHSRQVVVALEAELQQQSGVGLRIRHNAVLGYFVEASAKACEPLRRPPLDSVFIHRQTLANQARFTTAELNDLGARVLEAGERTLELELQAFEELCTRCLALNRPLRRAAAALSALDVAAGLAEWADEVGAVRPEVSEGLMFEAVAARHPVVEAAVSRRGDPYTANDCRLDGSGASGPRLSLVTGPNMAGKSTFLRQNALLVVLAQAGSFVPARSLRLGVVDRLFSRVGAGDDLARGRSTFMMEMVETAGILTQATNRSFVVLDEIGRGTATYDGLALAWACAEALHDANRCRALFATHYHELAQLEGRLGHVSNLSMRAREWNGELVFLHQAVAGAADRSYGVQVARLAGVPQGVVNRALEVLRRLESEPGSPSRLDDLPLFAAAAQKPAPARSVLETALQTLDPDALSPRDALDALYRLKALAAGAVPSI